MAYTRRILHHSPGPADLVGLIDDCRVPAGVWFELNRQGGCGDGELTLLEPESSGDEVHVGDWISFEYDVDDRWYLGRVQNRRSIGRGAERLTLAGMGRQLDDVFPGGFGSGVADGVPPHRYAATDLFSFDPDYSGETVDSVDDPADVVRLIVQQYVEPNSNVVYDSNLVDDPANGAAVASLKLRGEESAAAVLRDLALRSGGFSWGVNAAGKFFFLQPQSTLLATFQEGVDVVSLTETVRRDLVFNRLLLTGGYIYGDPSSFAASPPLLFRWRGHYLQPASRAAHGDRKFAASLPWIRTQDDSREFAREFLRTYAEPSPAYRIEVANQSALPLPWDGELRLKNAAGETLFTGRFERVRVQFDHSPRLQLELGPGDPRELWPEPPHDEDHPIGGPNAGAGGEEITFSGTFDSVSL